MSDQTPTDDTGRQGEDPRQRIEGAQEPSQEAPRPVDEGDDPLASLLRAAKADRPSDTDPDARAADSAGSDSPSFDELFEKRVREAAKEITPPEPVEAPAAQAADADEDNPLGVYAKLDQTEVPPVRPADEPRSSQSSSGRSSRRSRGRGSRADRGSSGSRESAKPAPVEAPEPTTEPELAPEPVEAPSDAAPQRMSDDSMMSRSSADLELPVHQQEVAPRKEVLSRVAEKDALSARQQGEAEKLAKNIAAAGPMLAVRYGPMRHIGLFQHHLDKLPAPGTKVTLRTSRGVELGEVASQVCGDSCGEGCGHSCVTPERVAEFAVGNGPEYPLKREGKVLRISNVQDQADNRELEHVCRDAKRTAREMIATLKLDMRIVTVEHLLGGERMVFYFASESRVDFRELVKQLTAKYQIRVELRQVGSRDEARLVGDFERCGRQCCCQTFLKELKPVSMRMAKVQKATLDPSKISGRCGRLMCCLRYEDDGYQELRHALPKKNIWIRTEALVGRVLRTHILTQLVEVQLFDRSLAVVGVEDILEVDVPEPTMAPQAERRPRAPMRERSSAKFLRDQPESPAAPGQSPASGDSGEAPAEGTKKRRRRRRKKKSPEGQGGGSQASAPAQPGQSNQPRAEGDAPRKKRRRRRRKPGSPPSE
jgi:cell fate regulator YaaT (PSP1 superfamily)